MKVKYNKKNKISDEDILKTKNFDQVLRKHAQISKSYQLLRTIGFIGAAGFVGALGWLIFKPSNENKTAPIVAEKSVQSVPVKTVSKPQEVDLTNASEVKNHEEEATIIFSSAPTSNASSIKQDEQKTPEENISTMIIASQDQPEPKDTLVTKHNANESWYLFNPIPLEKRTKLPTLLVAKHSWPTVLSKGVLVKSPELKTIYRSINREVPITKCEVYITQENAEIKPQSFSIKSGTFPPGLIRAIHKANENDILLFQNIEVFLPGKGRVKFGDYKVKIGTEKGYNTSLKNKAGIIE